jgi:hypothetical protein
MMTLAELYTLLKSITGFDKKVTYRAWPVGKAPKLPFICFLTDSSDNVLADNKVYLKRLDVDVELYTAQKDETSEGLVEALFDSNDIPWAKTEDYIDTENCYMITYSITI